jgi:hypothetical protein
MHEMSAISMWMIGVIKFPCHSVPRVSVRVLEQKLAQPS